MSMLGGIGKALGAMQGTKATSAPENTATRAKRAQAIKSVKLKVKFQKPGKSTDGEGRAGRTSEERRSGY